MRRWLAKRADFGANQVRGYQHSHDCHQRARAGHRDSHQPPGIARANPGSSIADNSSKYANSRSEYTEPYTCPKV